MEYLFMNYIFIKSVRWQSKMKYNVGGMVSLGINELKTINYARK